MALVKLNNRGVRSATTFGSISALGSMIFIKKQTASSSGTLSFVNGSSDVVLDNTYKEYLFTFKNIHTNADQVDLTFNGSDDTSSHSYDITKTTSFFEAFHTEDDGGTSLGYLTGADIAQGTGFQVLGSGLGNSNDENTSGYLHLFNPSDTTFVKHFISRVSNNYRAGAPGAIDQFCAGYFNTTSAITAIQFKMESGNIDAGDICLYGIN
jgi:hypothetical protein